MNAYIAGNANVGVTGGSFDVTANSNETATPHLTGVSVGIVASIQALTSNASVEGTSSAFVGAGANVSVTGGNLSVGANATRTATADLNAGGGGVVNVQVMNSSATTAGHNWAYLGEGSTTSATGVSVAASDNNSASNTQNVIGIGILSGSGLTVSSTVTPDVQAFVGPQAGGASSGALTKVTANTLSVTAGSTNTATAEAHNSGGGVIDVQVLNVNSTVDGATTTYLAGHDQINANGTRSPPAATAPRMPPAR